MARDKEFFRDRIEEFRRVEVSFFAGETSAKNYKSVYGRFRSYT